MLIVADVFMLFGWADRAIPIGTRITVTTLAHDLTHFVSLNSFTHGMLTVQ